LQTLLASGSTLQLAKLHVPGTSAELYCDTSTGPNLPFLSGVKFSNLSIHSAILVSMHQLSSFHSASCGQPFERPPHLGPSFPIPPALQGPPTHCQNLRNISNSACPLHAYSNRHNSSPNIICRISVQPHRSYSIQAQDGSHPHSGHHS
jgi:hypothetical protein